jgi:fructose-1-phosphate kinase PfkB-like protein
MTLTRVRAALRHASCLILSGSLPRGVPANAYAQLIRLARAAKVPVLLDCDGPALAAAVSAKPFLVKPNDHELAGWARSAGLPTGLGEASLRRAACALARATHGWVLVSRGAKPALLVNVTQSIELTATPPKIKPRNTVGAGDSLLAAVAQQIIHSAPPEAWLRAGLATGSKATQLPAGELPVR